MTETPRTIVITGASSGIGAMAATALAQQGADVVLVGRDAGRTKALAESIGADFLLTDFADLAQVRRLGTELLENYDQIDVLAHNAGLHAPARTVTVDGHELTLQVNYLAPFLLNSILLPRLRESAHTRPVRVISTSSAANRVGEVDLTDLEYERRGWKAGWPAYCTSKLANILFSRELARREAGTGIEAYAFHPGVVASRFGAESRLWRLGQALSLGRSAITPEAGAEPLVLLAENHNIEAPSGTYFDRIVPGGKANKQAADPELAHRLWEQTEQILGLTTDASA